MIPLLPILALAAALTFDGEGAGAGRTVDADLDPLDFFARKGCAIGPSTRAAARQAGLDQAAIDALADKWRDDPETVATGDWLVLPPQACTMTLPVVESALKLTDPDVQAAFSAADAYAGEDSPGCFLDGDKLRETTAVTRGWTADQAMIEYLRLVAQSMASGDLTFYTDSPLLTPYGIHLTTGSCGEVLPYREDARRGHEYLVENFDMIVRRNLQKVTCEYGGSWPAHDEAERLHNELQGISQHACLGFEAYLIVLGAGWYEGASLTEKGTPRPPLCHYPEAG